jgi:lipopolysaccharide/colanic/teichoic acid biosynthesis glycosyltransferase
MYPPIKRFFDLFFALLALAILSPILLIIIFLLRITGEGEVFYFQERVGLHNRRFSIWKFATMLKNSAKMAGGEITLRRDPRITRVGHFLRLSKLNELPQIVNILLGDMSWVGPRPLMSVSFEQYTPAVQAVVYQSRPGITGLGSVVFRDEELLVTESGMDPRAFYQQYIFPYKGALEQWYQAHKSFGVDFKLLLLTAWTVIFPKNDLVYHWFDGLPPRPDFPSVHST